MSSHATACELIVSIPWSSVFSGNRLDVSNNFVGSSIISVSWGADGVSYGTQNEGGSQLQHACAVVA